MVTKLKNLTVNSVDLVDQGANPYAHICLFKRGEIEGEIEKEVCDTMKIDKSKMTAEEAATLAEFEKKYGVADMEAENGADLGAELHPEVAKALADFQELTEKQNAEVAELKKSLEIERLTSAAQKYEVLGKKAPELAAKLYDLKKAGGTVYADYVALLDENLAALTKGGLFAEIGSSRQGGGAAVQTLGIKAQELQKAATGGLSAPDAIIKAWEENPDLAAQYEAEYMGR